MTLPTFTDRAIAIMRMAKQEAQRAHHSSISTGHALTALLSEGGGVAARIMTGLGMDLPQVRTRIEKEHRCIRPVEPKAEPELSPCTLESYRLAAEAARTLGDQHIGTEHLLLGLLCEGKGIAARVLADFGLTVELVENRLSSFGVRDDAAEDDPADGLIRSPMTLAIPVGAKAVCVKVSGSTIWTIVIDGNAESTGTPAHASEPPASAPEPAAQPESRCHAAEATKEDPPRQFRVRTGTFSAEQWRPGKQVEGVQEVCYQSGGKTVSGGYGMVESAIGPARIHPGDWIVTTETGEKYLHTDDYFRQTYEPVAA